MPDYNIPKRSAVQDANDGVINAPALRLGERRVSAKLKQGTSLDEGVAKVSSALGDALASKLKEGAANATAQKMQSAMIRQGQDEAVNTVDQNNKRTGMSKWLFGQDAGYEEAQKRAVENTIQKDYLETSTRIAEFAGETPEEFEQRRKEGLNELLTKYDDEDTRQRIAVAYGVSSQKLAEKQFKEHYAYTQTQNRETYAEQVMLNFDSYNLDAQNSSTLEEMQQVRSDAFQFFDGMTKPESMTPEAWRTVVNESLETTLRNGNIGAYNLAKQSGWVDTLKHGEKTAMDAAVGAYDTDFSQGLTTVFEDSYLGAITAKSENDFKQAWHDFDTQIEAMEQRTSGTERAAAALASVKRRAKQAQLKSSRETAKAQAKAEKQANIQSALRLNAVDQSAALSNIPDVKRSEIEAAWDQNMLEDIGTYMGAKEPVDADTAIKALADDPQLAGVVANKWKQSEIESPMVKRLTNTFVNGWGTMLDENDRPSERAAKALQSIAQFASDDQKFKRTIGDTDYASYEIIRVGVGAGKTYTQVNKEVEDFHANAGKKDTWATRWPLDKKQTKQDYVANYVYSQTGSRPVAQSLNYYMEQMDRGLQIYKGDFAAAKQYLRTTIKNANLTYQGRHIENGQDLNQVVEDYTFQSLVDGVQTPEVNLMTGYLSAMLGDTKDETGAPIRRLDQLKDYNIYTVDGAGGFFIDSQEAKAPVHITEGTMQTWGDVLRQAGRFNDLTNEAQGEALLKQYEEERELLKKSHIGYMF